MNPSFELFILFGGLLFCYSLYVAAKAIIEYFDTILHWKDDL